MKTIRSGRPKIAPAPPPATVMVSYFTINAGHTGLMAVFSDDGRLQEWTPYIRQASIFMSAASANAAIRGICAAEIAAAIASGRAVREFDDETGETVLMDYTGRRARPFRTPGIRLEIGDRRFDQVDEGGIDPRREIRRFVRGEFRTARRNPTRQTEALITPSGSADEYTMPVSERGRQLRRKWAA